MSEDAKKEDIPIELLIAIKADGYKEFPLNEEITWWRREPEPPVTWSQAPAQIIERMKREHADVAAKLAAMTHERDVIIAERDALLTAKPKPGWLTTEFWVTAGGMAATVVVAVQGQLADLGEALGPIGSKVVNLTLAVCMAVVGGRYVAARGAEKIVADERKKQISQGQ